MQKENPIIRDSIEITNNELATLSLTGFDEVSLLFIPEAKNDVNENISKLRVVHLSPNIPEVNIILDNQILFEDVYFREATNYINLPPNIYNVDIELAQNNRLLRSNRVRINPNGIYSLYMLGNFANFQVFRSLDGGAFITPVIRN